MNEQIKQLCEQSKVYANESTKDFTGNEPVVWMDYYTEKFTELIVRECIREIGFKSVELLDIDFYPHYQERLRKHFGVEE